MYHDIVVSYLTLRMSGVRRPFLLNCVFTFQLQVKDMIERERQLHVEEPMDPVHLIKKATIEQFRKIGINVDKINNEEK